MQVTGDGLRREATPIVHLTVTDPAGKDCRWYAQNARAPGGTAEVHIPLAYIDRPGRWHLTARDVLSGTTGTATVEVSARP